MASTSPNHAPDPASEVADFNTAYATAAANGVQSERDKLLVFAGGFLWLTANGGPEGEVVTAQLVARDIANKVDPFNWAAQLVLGLNVGKMVKSKADKKVVKDARNILARVEKLWRELTRRDELQLLAANLDPEGLADYIVKEGGVDGIIKRTADSQEDEDEVVDLSDMADAIETSGLDMGEAPFLAPEPQLGLVRVIDGKLRLVPLPFVPADIIAGVRDYLPNADDSAPSEVRYWGEVASLCEMFDRADSSVLARPDAGDVEGAPKLPSRPIVLVNTAQSMSIAASRVVAGMVVRIAVKTPLQMPGVQQTHLNGTDTLALARLAGSGTRGSFSGTKFSDDSRRLSFETKREGDKPLTLKFRDMADFGSSRRTDQWTLKVSGKLSVTAETAVEVIDGRMPKELLDMAGKAQNSAKPIVVSIVDGALSLAIDKRGQAVAIPGSGSQSGKVHIAGADLARVVERIVALRAPALNIGVDPQGPVTFRFATAYAEYQVVVPALLDKGQRSNALLDQVRRPGPIAGVGFASTPLADNDEQLAAA